jgi:hypothetical protein
MLSTLPIILRLSSLLNQDEIFDDYQCGFRGNRSTTDQILYIQQIKEKTWEYNGALRQLFLDFNEVCDSVTEMFTKFLMNSV